MKNPSSQEWQRIVAQTGVKPSGLKVESKVLSSISLEEYWMLIEKIETADLSPRISKRYKMISSAVFYLKSSLSEVLHMRGSDLKDDIKKLSAKKDSLHAVQEMKRLFRDLSDHEYIFPKSVHRTTTPLSRSSIVPLIVMSDSLSSDIDMSDFE